MSEEFNRRQRRTVGPVDQVALCDGAFCLSIFPTGGVVLLWLLGLIGRPSSGWSWKRSFIAAGPLP